MATYYVRIDGNDSNTGTGPAANQAWRTIAKSISSSVAPGDTIYIAPGKYAEANLTPTFTNPSSNAQRISYIGNPTASQFSGVAAGHVIITSFDSTSTTSSIFTWNKDYTTFSDLCFIGNPTSNSPTFGRLLITSGIYPIFTRCYFKVNPSSGNTYGIEHSFTYNVQGPTVQNCVFLNGGIGCNGNGTAAAAWDSQTLIIDNMFIVLSLVSNTIGVRIASNPANTLGGFKIINNYIASTGGVTITNGSSSTNPVIVQNNYIEATSTGLQSTNAIYMTQSNNVISAPNARISVNSSASTIENGYVGIDGHISRIQGFANYPYASAIPNTVAINAGINTNSVSTDIFGVSWNTPSTPTIGASETSSYTSTGIYVPTERNASTITIAPGSTSQSIELYLGVTGLTASTSGLSARYNRTRTASVSIPLVARTIAQAWTAGGFAEVDATNMPGVYRLDLPDAALAAGADDVTIVVRGASGTNGAVMTIKLSSGGLTSAQTASAVWGASPAGYNDATTFGGVVNEISNTVTGIDNEVQDIAGNVWDELRSGHTTVGTFGQYVNAELVTPVTSAALVRMGPFEVRADGLGASDPLDIQKGAQHGIDIQCVDNNGAGIDITSATVTAKVYNSGATLVDTYSCTATYAADGRATFTIDTTVTNSPGTYTATITRTTGASDTQVFGPLRIYVRDI